ncbi:MAG: enoyl-CoA hydratase-related protein [Desulfobacterota bacterium]|jgi:cyclohexa-1,5-dienecarbonyl-CoA hydratase|nr:enoyl-CoA hydratase-related protein [Thermodesulfobacteriota bacterium]
MGYQFIQTEVKDGLATITLNREPLNVLNIAMMKEINQALDALQNQSFKMLLFQAAGKAFSAGVDVGEHLGDQVNEMIEVFHGIFRRMDKLPAVSVAAVQGAALGGGCELALYCDLVIASEKAKFGQPEIQVGVFPPIAALILPRQIGRKKALELILSGEIISAQEALALGMVNKVVPAENLEGELQKFLGKFSGLSGLVMALTKKSFLAGLMDPADQGLAAIEKIYLQEMMKTHDAEEGLKAFLEKRKPAWQEK